MPELRHPYAPIRVAKKLEVGSEIALDAGATKSLRFREVNEKEAFTLRDADGAYFRASVLSLSAERAQVAIYERMLGSPESDARITLVCAVLARQRMTTVCQKATELGVARIVPVFSAHSVQRDGLDHEKPWSWKGQCIKAARQCRRSSLPELTEVMPLRAALAADFWTNASARFALDDRSPVETDPFPPVSAGVEPAEIIVAIGPEGGWSDDERAQLGRAGSVVLALGGRVLRAETAVFVGLSVVQHRLGDLRA